MAKARIKKEVLVAVENVAAYVQSREDEGWRLDKKGKPQWHARFKDNRVPLTFSRKP